MNNDAALPRRKRGGKTRARRLRGPDEIKGGMMSHRWWWRWGGCVANPFHDDYNRIKPLLPQAAVSSHIADRIRNKLMALSVADRRRVASALGIPLSLENRPLL